MSRKFRGVARRPRTGGFTLVEVTMVVAMIGIASAIALPRFGNSIARYRVEQAAMRLRADLVLARNKAIHESRSLAVVFTTGATSSYTVMGIRDPDSRTLPNYQVILNQEPNRASLSNLSLGGDDTIVFDGFGVPDSAGSIRVSVGVLTRTVLVDASSGEIRISTP